MEPKLHPSILHCYGLVLIVQLATQSVGGELQNLALGKHTFQISSYDSGPSENAVDNCLSQKYFDLCCTHTTEVYQPWWQVDLGNCYNIKEVVIYRRWDLDCYHCFPRMHNFRVFISTNSGTNNVNDVVFQDPRPEPPAVINIPVPSGTIGRYVKIDIEGRTEALTLCEVQVFGQDNITDCPGDSPDVPSTQQDKMTTPTTSSNEIHPTTLHPTNRNIAELLWNFTFDTTIEYAAKAAEDLDKLTSDNNTTLHEGDIIAATSILEMIVDTASKTGKVTKNVTDSFFGAASNLLDEKTIDTWHSLMNSGSESAVEILSVVDKYSDTILDVAKVTSSAEQVAKKNILAEFGSNLNCTTGIRFPSRTAETPEWARMSKNEIKMPCSSAIIGPRYTGAYYRNISGILPLRFENKTKLDDVSVNTAVMSFSLQGGYSGQLESPIEITFQTFDNTLSSPLCSFWNFDASNGSGAWDTDGCSLKYRDFEVVVCSCYHLTNFAVLMSAVKVELSEAHVRGLSVLSAVGCGVSMMCLFLTIVFHAMYWRIVTKDGSGRVFILVHLCSALILAYILFIAGINRTDHQVVCTVIAVLLHYIYLVVFFLMLAEGLNLALSIQFVLETQNMQIWKWLLAMAWAVPVLIVSISMAATQLNGYGGTNSCWLGTHSGLIWAFIAPALMIVLVNIAIIIFVVSKLFQTATFAKKSDRDKAKAGIRSICVLMPIMGTTWIIGVFSVNEDLIGFQYAFVVLNTLQGLFIFLLHCLFHKRIREGFHDSWRRWRQLKQNYSTSSQTGTQMETRRTATSTF